MSMGPNPLERRALTMPGDGTWVVGVDVMVFCSGGDPGPFTWYRPGPRTDFGKAGTRASADGQDPGRGFGRHRLFPVPSNPCAAGHITNRAPLGSERPTTGPGHRTHPGVRATSATMLGPSGWRGRRRPG